ncbi:MAG: penicillin-binding transpeptidase domain-containing protein [Pyrinomonadaceae bacterium]
MFFAVSANASAQSKKSSRAAAAGKTAKSSSDVKKDRKKADAAAPSSKSSKKDSAKSKNDRRESVKKERASAKDRKDAKKDDKKDKRDRAGREAKSSRETASAKDIKKMSKAERRKYEAERRRAEEERRQAILAEKRRREEAARIARERAIAFQRGLRTETENNIAKDNTEGEDLRVRAAAINALGNKAGTVVVMEAQTGKVLTIVNQDWAIRTAYRPCSTIKLVTGVAGLTEGVIDQEGQINDSNFGMSLDTALARSNNVYFQRVGSRLGRSRMVEYAKKLGLGERTGINLDGETSGRVPEENSDLKIYSHGDSFEISPLQLAVMASAIANGGKRVVPQVPVTAAASKVGFRPLVKKTVDVPDRDVEGVIPGMIGAAEWGTAHRGVDASLGIAGKTGSCITKGTWIGLFTSVAPIENPKYAVVVVTRGQSERGKYAAAVAGRVYQALAPQIRPSRNLALAEARFKTRSRVPDNVARSVADEDEVDDDAAAANEAASGDVDPNAAAAPLTVAPKLQQKAVEPVRKPLVTKTAQSQPKFPPVVITYKKDGSTNTKRADQPSGSQRPRVIKNK